MTDKRLGEVNLFIANTMQIITLRNKEYFISL